MLFFLRDEEIQENKVCARPFSPWGRLYQKDSFGCILQVNDFNFLAYFVCSTATPVLPQLYWTCRKHQYFVWFGFHPFNCLFAESYWAGPLNCSQGVTHLWPLLVMLLRTLPCLRRQTNVLWFCWGHPSRMEVVGLWEVRSKHIFSALPKLLLLYIFINTYSLLLHYYDIIMSQSGKYILAGSSSGGEGHSHPGKCNLCRTFRRKIVLLQWFFFFFSYISNWAFC